MLMLTTITFEAVDMETGIGETRLSSRQWGAGLLGIGSVGLIATCIFYVFAGPAAALPGGAPDTLAGLTATARSAHWMRAAGLAGMPCDVLLAVGALLLALHDERRGDASATAGWLGLAVSASLFIIVDAMVAFVLPAAASFPNGAAAYAGLRGLFDVLFTIGAWTAGVAALALSWNRQGSLLFRVPAAGWLMRAAGLIGVLASTAHLVGLPGAVLIGPGIAVLACAGLGAAWAYGMAAELNRSAR
jgi:hypothetical protein